MPLYHYTHHLAEILATGAIWTEDKLPSWTKVILALGSIPGSKAEDLPRPGVWLTSRNIYEPTAFPATNGTLITSVQELSRHAQPARIIVPESIATLSWREWTALHDSPAALRMIAKMKSHATNAGSDVMRYRISLSDIPVASCQHEIWRDGGWRLW